MVLLFCYLYLLPVAGPRLFLNYMNLDVVQNDSELQPHTRHNLVLGGSNLHICLESFDFFSAFVWFACFSWRFWNFRLSRSPAFCFCCLSSTIRRLPRFDSVNGWIGVTEFGESRAATSKARINVGTRGRSPLDPPSQYFCRTPESFPQHLFFTTWQTGLQMLWLHSAQWFFCCVLPSIRPDQFGFVLRTAMFLFRPRVVFLFFLFRLFCWCLPSWMFRSASTSSFSCNAQLQLWLFCRKVIEVEEARLYETATGYLWHFKRGIEAFRFSRMLQ